MTRQAAGAGRWMLFDDNGYMIGLITDKYAALKALGGDLAEEDHVLLCQVECSDKAVLFTSTNDPRYAQADAESVIKLLSAMTAATARAYLRTISWFKEIR